MALKAALFAFFLLAVETYENFATLSLYLPRARTFKLVLDSASIKILLLPAAIVVLFMLAAYFFVSYYFIYVINAFADSIGWKRLENRYFKQAFLYFNYFIFFSFLYGLNSFLFPDSSVSHFLLYSTIFPSTPYFLFLVSLAVYFTAVIAVSALFSRGKKLVFILILPVFLILIFFSDLAIKSVNVKKFPLKGNVLMLGVDSIQYNRFTKEWGYSKDLAPNMASILEKGTCFLNAWSPFARTYPSYVSILTGRYPIHSGIRDNLAPDKYLNNDNTYLGDVLKKNAYYSSHYTDEVRFSIIRRMHGFDKLFHPEFGLANYIMGTFFDYALVNLFLYTDTGSRVLWPLSYNRAHIAYNPEVFVNRAIREMNKLPRDKKQFIVVHLCANHFPYFVPYPFARSKNAENFSEKSILMADFQVAKLMDYFKKSGLFDDSIMALFSDHGDGWDPVNKMVSHGSNFDYLWCNRMILGFIGPDFFQKKIVYPVRSIDIYPTILEALGIGVPEGIDGVSLLGLVNGKTRPCLPFFAESGYDLESKYLSGKLTKDLGEDVNRFVIDPTSGIAYISDSSYRDVLKSKWYFMLYGGKALIYNPGTGEVVFLGKGDMEQRYRMFLGHEVCGQMSGPEMLKEIIRFNAIAD